MKNRMYKNFVSALTLFIGAGALFGTFAHAEKIAPNERLFSALPLAYSVRGQQLDAATIRLMQGEEGNALNDLPPSPLYVRSKRMRDAGIAMFVVSLVGASLAAGLIPAAEDLYPRDSIAGGRLYISGYAMASLGVAFIPGVVMWAVGQTRMQKALRMYPAAPRL